MAQPSTYRSFLCSFAILCMFAEASALGSIATISSSDIVLPELEGFSLLSSDSPGTHSVAAQVLEGCDSRLCAVYAGEGVGYEASLTRWEALAPFFQMQVMDDEFVIHAEQFKGLKQAMKADIDGLRRNISESIAATPFDVSVLSLKGDELEFLDAPVHVGDAIYEGDSYLAIPAKGSNDYKRSDGSMVRYAFDATFGFVHARDKVVVIMLFGPEKDSDWGKSTFEYVVRELVQANR